MPSPHLFPQLIPLRVRAALDRLQAVIWTGTQAAHVSKTADTPSAVPWSLASKEVPRPIVTPLHWGRLFHHAWFRVDLPPARSRRPRYLRWRDQGEATLYLDGEPAYGFDVAHRYAPLPPGVTTAWVEGVCCQSAIWHPAATGLDAQGSRFDGAEVVVRDEDAWAAWHDLTVLAEVVQEEIKRTAEAPLHAGDRPGIKPALTRLLPWCRRLLAGLDAALDVYDQEGTAALRRATARLFARLKGGAHDSRATLVGHAHIDLVWLWPERTGETKTVHTFATALSLMERYPEFCFSHSQPAGYEAVERRAPGLTRRVRAQIRRGRWEMLGAAYVESDTLLPCGEALVRGLQMGQQVRKEWGLPPTRLLWLPDVFGYAACLPQVMRLAGVDRFFTNKITWNRVTPFPLSSFRWRAPDGTEVLAHVSHETQQNYNGTATVRELRDAVETHRQIDVHDEAIVPTGYGDGGGGPTEEMCERARRLKDLVGVPRAEWGRADAFFDRLALVEAELPVWSGELYLELHRGTYTTHGELKSNFRAAERALQSWEAVRCAIGGGAIALASWRRLVFAQFHDAIPGSSIREVYAEMVPELRSIADSAGREAANDLTGANAARRDRAACLFNPLGHPVVCVVPGARGRSRRLLLPPLSGVTVRDALEAPATSRAKVRGGTLENEFVRADFNAAGEVVRLRVRDREVALSAPAGQLWLHADQPQAFHAWDVDWEALRLGRRLHGRTRITRQAAPDGMWAEVVFTRRVGHASVVTMRYRLVAGEAYLRLRCELDWREQNTLLKLAFPTDYAGQQMRFGGPFGSVLRSTRPGRTGDAAQWEVPASRWAITMDDGDRDGLFVVTKDKYGFDGADGRLALSLVRSALLTGEGPKHARALPQALREAEGPKHSDLGRHEIEMVIGHYRAEAPRAELPAMLAETAFVDPLTYEGAPCNGGLEGLRGGESLVPAWAQPLGERAWQLRLHETLGRRGEVEVALAPGWRVVHLRENEVADAVTGPVAFRPYEILTLRFVPVR